MPNASILVVEDESIVALDIKVRLENLGYSVCAIASFGEEAIVKAAETKPDLVLMDVRLKGDMDGVDTADRIRAQMDVPVIFLTAFADDETLRRAKITEPFGYILKPFEERELTTNIEIALYKYQMNLRLKNNERYFRALLENSSDIILVCNAQGAIRYSNQATWKILGYAPEAIHGKSIFDYLHEEDRHLTRKLTSKILEHPQEVIAVEIRARHRDGQWVYLEGMISNLLDDPAVDGLVVNARDISQRKQAELRIQRQMQQLTALRAIDTAITSSLDLKLTLDVLLEQVLDQLEVDAATVLLLNPVTLTLDYAAGKGFRSDALKHTHLPLGEGYAGRVAMDRRPVYISELATNPDGLTRAPFLKKEGFCKYYGLPLIAKGKVIGVLEIFHRSNFEPSSEWLGFLETLAGQAAIAVDNANLFTTLQVTNQELELAYDTTLEGWARALELRDQETEGHTQRVTDQTLRLAKEVGVDEEELVHIRRGALLHDIGKMGIPDGILLKPGPLSEKETRLMNKHPEYAYNLLSPIPFLKKALDIPFYHHEKWDGSGYPNGLKGAQIPLAARIFAVVDVWDALLSDRPYRQAWSQTEALDYIHKQAGKYFDPEITGIFLEMLRKDFNRERNVKRRRKPEKQLSSSV